MNVFLSMSVVFVKKKKKGKRGDKVRDKGKSGAHYVKSEGKPTPLFPFYVPMSPHRGRTWRQKKDHIVTDLG